MGLGVVLGLLEVEGARRLADGEGGFGVAAERAHEEEEEEAQVALLQLLP